MLAFSVILFVVLLLLGVPVVYSIGLATACALLGSMDFLPTVTAIAQQATTGIDSFALLAIPFFILAGQLMNRGGIARRLVELAKALLGTLPGGLGYVNILACMLFGAISGSAVAAVAAIGSFLNPMMKKEGYETGFNAAVNTTSATTGLLIPPSNILIVFSLASGGTSIAALFLAGYLPGILTGLLLMLVAGFIAVRRGYPRGASVSALEVGKRFLDALPSLLLIVIVMGGIVSGIFTATEGAAVAVVYTFLLAVVFYREVKWTQLPEVLRDAAGTTSIVMVLIGVSVAMSWVLAFESIPQSVSETLLALSDNKWVLLIIMNLILLAVGTFMDMTPAVLIFTPIFLPLAKEIGLDPVHFGIIMVFNLCIGLCTPPVGTALFVGCSVAQTTIKKMIRPLLPFFGAMLLSLALIVFFEDISLWLPRLLGY